MVGFHSNRRKPDAAQVERVDAIYRRLLAEERQHEDRKRGLAAGTTLFDTMLREKGVSYERFAFSL